MEPLAYMDRDERISVAEEVYRASVEASRRFNAYISIREWDEVYNDLTDSRGPLAGILLPVKDNISTRGLRTTCGSRILSNYIPPFDAHVIETLKRNGVAVLGKTNMDEFAMGNSGETSYYGPSRNPWSTDRIPGGSSSGSAVTVAYRGYIALGSDTGGSIRQPAGFNHILGLKPTYGSVSRYGLIAYAESLEQIGPMARFPVDLALIQYYLMEPDPRDITMYIDGRGGVRDRIRDIFEGRYRLDLGKYRIFYSPQLLKWADEDIVRNFHEALEFFKSYGVKVVEFDGSFLDAALSAYYIIAMVEASSNLARYDGSNYGLRIWRGTYWESVNRGRVDGFGVGVKRRIIMGGYASCKGYEGRYYLRALKARRWIRDRLMEIMDRYTFLMMPTSPSLPPRFGEILGPKGYIQDIYTVIPNLTGQPAITIPTGFIDGLPVSIQLIGYYHTEPELIYMAMISQDGLYDPNRIPGDD